MRHDPRLREGIPRLPLDPEPRPWVDWTRVGYWLGRIMDANVVAGGVSFIVQANEWDSTTMYLIGWAMITFGLLSLTNKDRDRE